MKKILVVGSMNMDMVVITDEMPESGETVFGRDLQQIPGGKGANQALAMAKLGSRVKFLGKVGNDVFGETLLSSLSQAGIDIVDIERDDGSTGIAIINVDKNGDNNIVVVPGANWKVDGDYLEKNRSSFKKAHMVVFQLEIPFESVRLGLKIAKEYGKTTILNPAPARDLDDLDDEIIKNIDILIPNEHELGKLAGIKITDEASILKAGDILLAKGIKEIVVTLGSKGIIYINKDRHKSIKSYPVKVVDTTAAGDSFIGGFASSYLEEAHIEKAIDLGQKTAALAIQKHGAQSSIPTKEEVENFKIN